MLLGKSISPLQWLALLILMAGVVLVQDVIPWGKWFLPAGRALSDTSQDPMVGIGAFLFAAVLTSFASVYFEKMLKGASKPSLWLRNMQLASYSSLIAAISLTSVQNDASLSNGVLVVCPDGYPLTVQCSLSSHRLTPPDPHLLLSSVLSHLLFAGWLNNFGQLAWVTVVWQASWHVIAA